MLNISAYIFLSVLIIVSGIYVYLIFKKSKRPEKPLKLETII
jgi:hypothetical protein